MVIKICINPNFVKFAKSKHLKRKALSSAIGIATASLLASSPAMSEGLVLEEVVVTGSYIRGTPEDAALPVDVIDAEELAARGSPTALDMIRAMPFVTSVVTAIKTDD